MKITSPPHPPFSKGELGGFESYFLRKSMVYVEHPKIQHHLL
jgi:hypothetical protein